MTIGGYGDNYNQQNILKTLVDSSLNVKFHGAKGDGTTDDSAAIQAALDAATNVYLPPGAYALASPIWVKSGGRLYGAGAATTLIALNDMPDVGWGSNHQDQMVRLSADSEIADLVLDGGGFNSGGVAVWSVANWTIRGLRIRNSVKDADEFSQGILATEATRGRIEGCDIYRVRHGMQIWLCSDVQVLGNNVDVVAGGGIFTAASNRVLVEGNTVRNAHDVGIDFEGGTNCISNGNHVSRCRNGELALFTNAVDDAGCHRLKHVNNVVVRETQYTKYDDLSAASASTTYGACAVHSLSDSSVGCGFWGNDVTSNESLAFSIHSGVGTTNQGLFFNDNNVHHRSTSRIFRVTDQCYALTMDGNTFELFNTVAAGAELKNCRGLRFTNNTFLNRTTQSASVVKLYTSVASMTDQIVADNKGYGFATAWFEHDSFSSNARNITLARNLLSAGPITGGGLTVTSSGEPRWMGQQLRILLDTVAGQVFDFRTLIGKSGTDSNADPFISWQLFIVEGASYKNQYEGHLYVSTITSRDGSGTGTGKAASASFYATFSGTTITLTGSGWTGESYLVAECWSR